MNVASSFSQFVYFGMFPSLFPICFFQFTTRSVFPAAMGDHVAPGVLCSTCGEDLKTCRLASCILAGFLTFFPPTCLSFKCQQRSDFQMSFTCLHFVMKAAPQLCRAGVEPCKTDRCKQRREATKRSTTLYWYLHMQYASSD